MYYIRLVVDGKCKYLYNERLAVYLPDYAKAFRSRVAALQYLKGKQVGKEHAWWMVQR
ncbi:hypothetical protein LI291_05120 [Intestinibacillus massiliensis]|uniref:hypothetical protein n=1 Tax=Intestinibacillus massiliensis TaxID=1871029 RepID=UPI00135647A8|nr:hypothetical protein [Intestinibacillus massiliensis]MCB6365563.1 hypothetical protein [Intestinibacillus massiliensis]